MSKSKAQQKANTDKIQNSGSFFKSPWAYFTAFFVLLFIGIIFYFPSLKDQSISAHDFQQGISAAHQVVEEHKRTGEYPNWAPNMFSGMPSFQIYKSYSNISSWLSDGLYHLTNPYIFITLLIVISSVMLFYAMGVHPIIVLIGGIALMFSNFTIISLYAGHNNKVMVMSVIPMTLAGIWLLFERKKYLVALSVIALSISLQVRLLHVQITYFMCFLVGFWILYNIFFWIKNKEYKHLILSLTILFVGIGLGAINNATQLISTKQYSEETQRGGPSEVEISKTPHQKASDGVGYDYATAWSYGKLETFTLLIPNFSGGPELNKKIDESNPIAQAMIQNGIPAQSAIQVAQQLPTYWGSQPFVAGTTYIGASLIFLMLLGLFLLKDNRKWWLLAGFVTTLFVAWGDNFSLFYHFLFDNLPYFNKFRTPSMVFYLSTIIVTIIAVLTLNMLAKESEQREIYWDKFLKVSLGALGFMLILTILGPSLFSFSSESLDANLKAQLLQMTQNNSNMADAIFGGLIQERKSMMRADTFRSLIIIAIVIAFIAAFIKRKVSSEIMLVCIALVILVDIVGVDKRYVTYESFKDNSTINIDGVIATNADKFILQDKSNYRVLDLSVNTFNDAKPTYFHKSIGGYHSVKLKRYQDLISFQINNNLQQFQQGNPAGAQVLNMLNTKYIITSPEENGVYKNDFAYGNAWLVNQVKVLDGSVAVFDNLMNEDLSKTALLEKPSEQIPQTASFVLDSNAKIELIKSSNDELIYKYSSTNPAYAVFSEIYYNNGKGWSAYIDGKHVNHDQVDYVLRGLSLPAGEHEIAFRFDNPLLLMTEKIDLASSIIIIIICLGGIFQLYRKKRKGVTA